MKDIRQGIERRIKLDSNVKEVIDLLVDLVHDVASDAFQAGEKNIDYKTKQENGEWVVEKTYKTNARTWISENLK
jgi:20S proteasome alpha/beta subunit